MNISHQTNAGLIIQVKHLPNKLTYEHPEDCQGLRPKHRAIMNKNIMQQIGIKLVGTLHGHENLW
jgi:hypothetical protein